MPGIGSGTAALIIHRVQIQSYTPWNQYCGSGAEELKLNCLPKPEPKLRIAAPAPALVPFYLPQI
jgi:hypothetical protein